MWLVFDSESIESMAMLGMYCYFYEVLHFLLVVATALVNCAFVILLSTTGSVANG